MNNVENLLVTVGEECAEIQQATSKSLRFGIGNHHPDTPNITNGYDIVKEFYQLSALITHLQAIGELPCLDEQKVNAIRNHKLTEVRKWQVVSRSEGTLN